MDELARTDLSPRKDAGPAARAKAQQHWVTGERYVHRHLVGRDEDRPAFTCPAILPVVLDVQLGLPRPRRPRPLPSDIQNRHFPILKHFGDHLLVGVVKKHLGVNSVDDGRCLAQLFLERRL